MDKNAPDFRMRSVYFAHPMGRPRPHVRIFADVGERAFEFVQLDKSSAIEAYDYPRAWAGVARFLGYLTSDQSAQVLAVARRWVDVAP